MARPRILFLCPGDASRSVIAKGFARYYAGELVEVDSASLDPKPPSEYIVWGMNEVSIDVAEERGLPSNSLHFEDYDYIVTLSDGGPMPVVAPSGARARVENWDIADPSSVRGQTSDVIRSIRLIRYNIEAKVQELLKKVLA